MFAALGRKNIFKFLVFLNAFVRIALLSVALSTDRWFYGDSGHYLRWAKLICEGKWGGDSWRMPLYMWFLSLSSGCSAYQNELNDAAGGGVFFSLIAQSTLVFAAGLFFYKWLCKYTDVAKARVLCLIFLFDPVLLAYSHLIMSDALFALTLLASAAFFYDFLKTSQTSALRWFAFSFGLSILCRPIGLPLGLLTALVLALLTYKKQIALKHSLLAATIALALLLPRFYWNYSNTGKVFLSEQSSEWIKTVAGIVENDGKGLSFLQSEKKWYDEHPNHSFSLAVSTLTSHAATWLRLTFKGIARVLLGHVNVEWGRLMTGKTITGPGWFKVVDPGVVSIQTTSDYVFWTMGIVLCLIYCLLLYAWSIALLMKTKIENMGMKCFYAWLLSTILFLACIPQLYGDARFRAAYWPLLLLLIGVTNAKSRRLHQATDGSPH